MALSVVLYDMYAIVLWRRLEPFYDSAAAATGWSYDTPTYNNMELTGIHGPDNKYWFELVRRQARNLYLNMQHGTSLARPSAGGRGGSGGNSDPNHCGNFPTGCRDES